MTKGNKVLRKSKGTWIAVAVTDGLVLAGGLQVSAQEATVTNNTQEEGALPILLQTEQPAGSLGSTEASFDDKLTADLLGGIDPVTTFPAEVASGSEIIEVEVEVYQDEAFKKEATEALVALRSRAWDENWYYSDEGL